MKNGEKVNSMERAIEKKGVCDICQTTYVKEKYWHCHDPPDEGYSLQPCPECRYDPCMEERIEDALFARATISITVGEGRMRSRLNTKELTGIIKEIIRESWPIKNNKNDGGG